MALSFSPRVMKNLAQQMVFTVHQSGTTTRYTRLAFVFVKNTVAIPTDDAGIYNYLNTCLNNSAYGGTGGAGANQSNILGWVCLGANQASISNQNNNLASWTTSTTVTAVNSGTIGSVICLAPTQGVTDGMSVTQGSGGATATTTGSGLVLTNTATDSAGSIMIGSGITSANFNSYSPEYFSSFNFITDSVGTSGTPVVKVSTMDVTAGTNFQMLGFKLRINSFN